MRKFFSKEFLWGLGIGFILSALFVTMFGSKPMTEAEIKAAAGKLGMVAKTETAARKTDKPPAQPTVGQTYEAPPKTGLPPVTNPVERQPEPAKRVVSITITDYMGSEDIANMLAEKGVVKSSREFQRVVDNHNAATRFRNGTFNLTVGEDMDKLVKIMTGR